MTYPRYGQIMKRPNPKAHKGTGSPCIVCGELTTGRVAIQVNIFRGDDDVVPVCKDHLKKRTIVTSAYRGYES